MEPLSFGSPRDITIRLEIYVRVAPDGTVSVYPARDSMGAQPLQVAREAAQPDEPIAGSIRPPAPDDLDSAVERWLAHLAAKGCAENSVRSYRALMKRARKGAAWTRLSQLSYETVIAYLDSRREEWSVSTANCNLTAWKSFARFLIRSDRRWQDVLGQLLAADRCTGQQGEGARASTTQEARDMIAVARYGRLDGRSKSPRDVVWSLLFLAGLRGAEPGELCWKHVRLDEPIPYIWWGGLRGASHKGKRQLRIAMVPELADILRAHRETVPHTPDSPIFPICPPRWQWDKDRETAGIDRVDERGRAYTRHAARKWLSTTLTAHGLPEKLVDFMMRHRGKAEARYYDPSLEDQAVHLRTLPRFFDIDEPPENKGVLCDNGNGPQNSSPKSLDMGAGSRHTHQGTRTKARGEHPAQSDTGKRPTDLPACFESQTVVTTAPVGPLVVSRPPASVGRAVPGCDIGKCQLVALTPIIDTLLRSDLPGAQIADALEALARLIRLQGATREQSGPNPH